MTMSIYDSIRQQNGPITPEGYPHRRLCADQPDLFWIWAARLVGTVLTLWCVYFFRDPPRVTPVREGLVVSPADGRISQVTTAAPPHELGSATSRCAHLNLHERVRLPREPQPGHRPGRKMFITGQVLQGRPHKASATTSEFAGHLDAGLRMRWGCDRGLVARRSSVSRARAAAARAAAFRHDPFGSRLDVYLPEGTRLGGDRSPRSRARPCWPICAGRILPRYRAG